MIPEKASDTLLSALLKGGEALMTHLGKTSAATVKESISSVVTEADLASEKVILEILSKRVRNIRSTNSLVDFCYTADGRLGAVLNQTTKIRDIATPWLMISEAGGKVTDIQGKEIQFDLSAGAFDRNYTILASGAKLHGALMLTIELK